MSGLRRGLVALRWTGRLLLAQPWLITVALCTAELISNHYGADLPAQLYRSWLVRHHGLPAWNNEWYDGHQLLGYSIITPVVGAVIGVRLLGAIACVASSWVVCRLLPDPDDRGQLWCRVLFAVATVADLAVGRTAFAVALALGLAALLAAFNHRLVIAGILAIACSLASPLAGLFLVLFALAWVSMRAGWRPLPLFGAAIGIGASSIVGSGVGRFPFPTWHLAILEATVLAGLIFVPREQTLVRRFLYVYGAAAIVLYAVPNPIGSNVLRLSTLIAAPLTVLVFANHRQRTARVWTSLTVLGFILGWHLPPVEVALADSAGDPSAAQVYYTPLLHELDSLGQIDRIEVPMTRDHWESFYVAQHYPLARGWDRQIDVAENAVLYHPLTDATYRSWLLNNAVGYVALPDVPLDNAGQHEAALLTDPPSWLTEVWSNAHWQLYRVDGARPLASRPATLVDLDVTTFTLQFGRAGDSVVRIRWSPLFTMSEGTGCISRTADGWTSVSAPSAETVTVSATLAHTPSHYLDTDASNCTAT
jgi:MFS family permease